MKTSFKLLLALIFLAHIDYAGAQLLTQDFSGIPNGTNLRNNPVPMGNGQWSQPSGASGGVFFNNGAMVQNWTWQIARYVASSAFWTTGSGTGVFSVDFLTTDSAATSTRISLSEWGGAGFSFQLTPTQLQTGSGTGGVYGSVTYANTAALSLVSNTWYTAQIVFSLTGQTSTTTGTLSIYDKSNMATPLASVSIGAIEGTGELDQLGQIDMFNIANTSAQTMFDNVSLLAVPEPASALPLTIGAVILLAGYRHRGACMISARA